MFDALYAGLSNFNQDWSQINLFHQPMNHGMIMEETAGMKIERLSFKMEYNIGFKCIEFWPMKWTRLVEKAVATTRDPPPPAGLGLFLNKNEISNSTEKYFLIVNSLV